MGSVIEITNNAQFVKKVKKEIRKRHLLST